MHCPSSGLSPELAAAAQVALLEPSPGNSTLQWPWVSRGTPEPGVNRVQAVSVPAGGASSSSKDGGLLERALAAVLAGYSGGSSSIMSTAGKAGPSCGSGVTPSLP